MTDSELQRAVDRLKAIMIAVATGGPRIDEVQAEFTELYDGVSTELANHRIRNPLPYRDLWEWYGRYSGGEMPKYQQRRAFVSDLFRDLIRDITQRTTRPNAPDAPMNRKIAAQPASMQWDVFVSHASEDKEDFARPLAERLQQLGLRVWFDAFTLTVGDSLRQCIDRGLASSRYGVVVISPDFLKKQWPQIELDGMVAREVEGIKVVLPILHKIEIDEVRARSPILATKLAVSSKNGIEHVVKELWRAIRRDEEPAQIEESAGKLAARSADPVRHDSELGALGSTTIEQKLPEPIPQRFSLTTQKANPQGADFRDFPISYARPWTLQCRIASASPYFRFGFKLLRQDGRVFGDAAISSLDPNVLLHIARNDWDRPRLKIGAQDIFFAAYMNGQSIEDDRFLFAAGHNIALPIQLTVDTAYSLSLTVKNEKIFQKIIPPDFCKRVVVYAWGDREEYRVDVEDFFIGPPSHPWTR